MGFVGLEEIFLKVKDMEKALDFYHNNLGLPSIIATLSAAICSAN